MAKTTSKALTIKSSGLFKHTTDLNVGFLKEKYNEITNQYYAIGLSTNIKPRG
jgi:hypothetical protein